MYRIMSWLAGVIGAYLAWRITQSSWRAAEHRWANTLEERPNIFQELQDKPGKHRLLETAH